MPRTTTLSFEEFKALADGQNLRGVTQDEYREYYVDKPDLSAGGSVRTIRHYRKAGEREQEVVIGFAAGSRQFTSSNVPLMESQSQLVTIITPDGPREFITRGNWNGQHGRKVEVEATRKPGGKFWGIKRTTTDEAQWRHQNAVWKHLDGMAGYELERDGVKHYEIHMIRGTIGTVFPQKNWDAGKDLEAGREPTLPYETDDYGRHNWPIKGMSDFSNEFQTDYPTATVYFQGDGVSLSAHFGPFKQAKPFIAMEDWDTRGKEDADDLKAAVEGLVVGVVGTIYKTKQDVKDGKDITRLQMDATALIMLDDAPIPDDETSTTDRAQSGGIQNLHVPADGPGNVVGSADMQARIEGIYSSVRKHLTAQRQGATVETIRQADSDNELVGIDDTLIELAINQLRAQGVGAGTTIPEPTAAAERPSDTELSRLHKLIKLDDEGAGVAREHIEQEMIGFGWTTAKVEAGIIALLDEGNIFESGTQVFKAVEE